ncbi:Kinase A inhibitor [Streptomyces sp. YIM 130001]|uniref:5-oxoprolinase subunit B family protein n=1 Tax=Streptomyces sp. YIM 130001 TaxID=2259644 RepID=UPI000E64AE7B|nr:allophanate hydrolase subunit 1 [Streptomyces sp. YIM 130001]RII14007.1 Kinase A inhibitor [Streptomyces sp. YIM 130001]
MTVERTPRLRVLPYGPNALLVECADHRQVQSLHAELLHRRTVGALPPVREIVPGERTVLLDGLDDPDTLAGQLSGWTLARTPDEVPGPALRIPVRYDGADLDHIARHWQVDAAEAARRHSAARWRVAFCGFVPGFAYLTGGSGLPALPRRATPRTRVPAGAVGLAGPYTGVYPRASPGGWQLIGTVVDIRLWDPHREPAALLAPGAQVYFEPVPG